LKVWQWREQPISVPYLLARLKANLQSTLGALGEMRLVSKMIKRGATLGSSVAERMEIKVFNNNVEKALKVAKKKLAGEGLFRELKRRRFYEKPSVRKKAKQREAQRRRQKWLSKRKPE